MLNIVKIAPGRMRSEEICMRSDMGFILSDTFTCQLASWRVHVFRMARI